MWQATKQPPHEDTLAPLGLEPWAFRLLAINSDQLIFETAELASALLYNSIAMLTGLVWAKCFWAAHSNLWRSSNPVDAAPEQLPFVVASSLRMSVCHAAERLWVEHSTILPRAMKTEQAETRCPSRIHGIAQPCI